MFDGIKLLVSLNGPEGDRRISGGCDQPVIPRQCYITSSFVVLWRVADGEEVGKLMDAKTAIGDAAISPDGKWIVAGTLNGQVIVWNAKSREKTRVFRHAQ